MKNSTLYASDLSYEFEKQRIQGETNVERGVKKNLEYSYPEKLEYLEDTYDEKTGTSATAFRDKDTGEIILSYTGTNLESGVRESIKDGLKSDFGEIGLGLGSTHYEPAYEFYEKIREKYGDNIILTGHSLGGNIAQRVALKYNVQKTIVYNPAPLYTKFRQMLANLLSKGQERTGDIFLNNFTSSTIRTIAYPMKIISNNILSVLSFIPEEYEVNEQKKCSLDK